MLPVCPRDVKTTKYNLKGEGTHSLDGKILNEPRRHSVQSSIMYVSHYWPLH